MSEKIKYNNFRERYADPEYKAKFRSKYDIPMVCECGTHIGSKLNFSKHIKSKKHIVFMEFLKHKLNE